MVFCSVIYANNLFSHSIVGSLASEFQGWSWKTHVGILISAQIFAKFDDFSMYIVPVNDDQFIQIIKIIKLGKNMGRNEKTHIGIPTLDIGIPT